MRKDNQLTPITRMNQMLELSDKDFNAAIIQMLQQIITNSLETNRIKLKESPKSLQVPVNSREGGRR